MGWGKQLFTVKPEEKPTKITPMDTPDKSQPCENITDSVHILCTTIPNSTCTETVVEDPPLLQHLVITEDHNPHKISSPLGLENIESSTEEWNNFNIGMHSPVMNKSNRTRRKVHLLRRASNNLTCNQSNRNTPFEDLDTADGYGKRKCSNNDVIMEDVDTELKKSKMGEIVESVDKSTQVAEVGDNQPREQQ
ncbi:unnamed protein product [Amaranthus hypochondriacus]